MCVSGEGYLRPRTFLRNPSCRSQYVLPGSATPPGSFQCLIFRLLSHFSCTIKTSFLSFITHLATPEVQRSDRDKFHHHSSTMLWHSCALQLNVNTCMGISVDGEISIGKQIHTQTQWRRTTLYVVEPLFVTCSQCN